MRQIFERGQELDNQSRIRKLICEGDEWQVYQTNNQEYVLAVTTELYSKWDSVSAFPEGFFQSADNFYYLIAAKDNLISSLQSGPYPTTAVQILKFSAAFKEAMRTLGISKMQNAIYLEEYGLFLPVPSTREEPADAGTLYAAWLTGGVNISVDQGNRFNTLMSWMASDALAKSKELAGFETKEEEEKTEESATAEQKKKKKLVREVKDGRVPPEPFELLGRPELEQFFNDNIVDIVRNREKYKRMGIDFPGATILYGPPGCGKTYAIDRLAEYLGWPRFDIDSNAIASPFIHDTSKKISEIFTKAIKSAPSILVIDEMEAFLTDRSASGLSGTHHVEEVAEFLRQIPEAISSGVLIFAMTNLIDNIDPAILRRGRFDHMVEVRMANAEEIEALLKKRFSDLPIDSDVESKRIAKKLDGHPLSDVTFVLREAGRFAVKNDLELINKECFDQALNLLPNKKDDKPRIGFQ